MNCVYVCVCTYSSMYKRNEADFSDPVLEALAVMASHLISLEMGTRQQALMGCTAISLWEEAAPLERNRTGWGREGRAGLDQCGTAGPCQTQKPLSSFVFPPALHCSEPSLAPVRRS